MDTMRAFIFLNCKITADDYCSYKIKRCLLLGRKNNLDSILKRSDIILPTKVHLVKAMAFPVVMYRYESWAIKSWTIKLSAEELMLLNCGAGEDSSVPCGLQGNQTSQF